MKLFKMTRIAKTILLSSTLVSSQAFALALSQADDGSSSQMMQNSNSSGVSSPMSVSTPSTQPQSPVMNNQTVLPNSTAVSPSVNNQMMAPPSSNALPVTPPSNNNLQQPSLPAGQISPPPTLFPQSKNEGDKNIVEQIQMSMATNNDVIGVPVKVACKNGIVSLIGTVGNYVEANTLIMIAEAVPGVKGLDLSLLKLNNNQALSQDAIISAKIKGSFVREKLFTNTSLAPIKVITFNGIVTLIGNVTDQAQALNAVNIAKSIDGVSTVKSEIVIVKQM